jgi:hypothetical protein
VKCVTHFDQQPNDRVQRHLFGDHFLRFIEGLGPTKPSLDGDSRPAGRAEIESVSLVAHAGTDAIGWPAAICDPPWQCVCVESGFHHLRSKSTSSGNGSSNAGDMTIWRSALPSARYSKSCSRKAGLSPGFPGWAMTTHSRHHLCQQSGSACSCLVDVDGLLHVELQSNALSISYTVG